MTTPHIAPAMRRARIAVSLLFLTNGALLANILPRYPEVKAQLGLDAVAYGVAIAAFPAGAIVAGLASASLIRRFGSARVAVAGAVLTSIALLGAGLAPSALLFALGLFLAGAIDSMTDVGQNAHSLRVQRGYPRSIINSFHAIWSIGAVIGGSMAAAAIALNIPVGLHLGISAILFSAVALIALRLCLPGPDAPAEPALADGEEAVGAVRRMISPRTIAVFIALALLSIVGAVVEDGGMSWATLYLSESMQAPVAIAATGYIALVAAQFIGRLIGDGFVDRFGQRAVARVGAIIATAGMALALAFPTIPGTIIGFAAAGLGTATLIPAAFQAVDELPGLRHGSGITVLAWLLRLGFLLSPPAIGLIAENADLRTGLLLVPIACAIAIVLAGVLETRTAARSAVDTHNGSGAGQDA